MRTRKLAIHQLCERAPITEIELIPFIEMLITKNDNKLETQVYRKPTMFCNRSPSERCPWEEFTP